MYLFNSITGFPNLSVVIILLVIFLHSSPLIPVCNIRRKHSDWKGNLSLRSNASVSRGDSAPNWAWQRRVRRNQFTSFSFAVEAAKAAFVARTHKCAACVPSCCTLNESPRSVLISLSGRRPLRFQSAEMKCTTCESATKQWASTSWSFTKRCPLRLSSRVVCQVGSAWTRLSSRRRKRRYLSKIATFQRITKRKRQL